MKQVQDGNRPPDKYRVPVFNQSSETVPPYGAMQVASSSSVGDDKLFNVIKPNGAPGAKVYLNGPVPIPAQSYGSGTDEYPAEALIAGTPVFNAEIGPVNGSWALSVSGKGFQYLGGLASGVGRVAAKGGTSAGDDFPLVKIVNSSGLPRAFGSIVGFGLPVDPPPGTLHRIPTFLSKPPEPNLFAILLGDLAVGATGDAAPIGIVAAAQVNLTDANHSRVKAITNSYDNLASATDGPGLILWREKQGTVGGGTLGLQWARILFGQAVATSEDIRGVTLEAIPPATGQRTGPITPGSGQVRIYTMPTSGNAGTAWQSGPTVTAENWMFVESIAAFKPVLLKPSRKDDSGNQIYIVHAEGCKEIPSSG